MIGERLSEIRKDHGDKQADLAARLGVSLSTVRAWEQGKSAPGHDMLVQICRLYGVSSDYLLGLNDLDPLLYARRQKTGALNANDLAELKNFERFLRWKKRRK